jgi:hypothetical protein
LCIACDNACGTQNVVGGVQQTVETRVAGDAVVGAAAGHDVAGSTADDVAGAHLLIEEEHLSEHALGLGDWVLRRRGTGGKAIAVPAAQSTEVSRERVAHEGRCTEAMDGRSMMHLEAETKKRQSDTTRNSGGVIDRSTSDVTCYCPTAKEFHSDD